MCAADDCENSVGQIPNKITIPNLSLNHRYILVIYPAIESHRYFSLTNLSQILDYKYKIPHIVKIFVKIFFLK